RRRGQWVLVPRVLAARTRACHAKGPRSLSRLRALEPTGRDLHATRLVLVPQRHPLCGTLRADGRPPSAVGPVALKRRSLPLPNGPARLACCRDRPLSASPPCVYNRGRTGWRSPPLVMTHG